MGLERRIVNINEYDLVATPEEFTTAIQAVAARTQVEGHRGVTAYQFYVNATERTAGAAIVYEDAAAWVAHHQMAYQWDEMPVLQATVKLKRLTLLGPLSEEMESWLAGADITVVHYDTMAAGFRRDA